MKRFPSSVIAGTLLVLLGGVVMVGWWQRITAFVHVLPGFAPMVFSTALSFVLAGCALLTPTSDRRRHRLVTSIFGAAVAAIALAVMAEHWRQLDLGFDWTSLHVWLPDATPRPGRMSLPAAYALLMGATALILAPRVRSRAVQALVRALILAVGIVGILGIVGYLLSAPLLFPGYAFAGVPMHTAAGLLIFAAGLYAASKRLDWPERPVFVGDDDRITLVGATILAVIAVVAGIASFAILQGRVQIIVAENVLTSLLRRVETFHDFIDLREINARIAATRPAVIRNLRVIHAGTDDGSNIANVNAVVESFLMQGFSGLAYYDVDGKIIATGGAFSSSPQMSVELATTDKPQLMWDNGFLLRHRLTLKDSTETVGAVMTEQPLPVLTRLALGTTRLGATGETGLCILSEEHVRCFPNQVNARAYTTPTRNSDGAPLPVVRAMNGETGTVVIRDYRDQYVVAAYGPVGELGLGMVVKVDTAEIFQPIREQLEVAMMLLLFFAGAGTVLLRSTVKPLATKLIDAETQARREERKFKGLLESAPDAVLILSRQGKIVLVNSQAEKLFGYGRAEMLDKKFDVLLPRRYHDPHSPGPDDHVEPLRRVPLGSNLELYARRKDGSEFPVEVSSSPLETEGEVLISSAIRDITERKDFERQLQQANRLKSEFLANMSHELRTPLNGIIGFAEVLIDHKPGPLNDKQTEYLHDILSSGRHLLELINEVLDLSRVEAGRMTFDRKTFPVATAIAEVCAVVAPLARKKDIDLSSQVAPGLDLVTLDPQRFKQVLYNLLSNALKFTQEGGAVGIAAAPLEESRFELRVKDNGIGIREADIPRLFREFEQLESGTGRRFQGTGLGLALTRKIVELQGGTISVESEFGKGSTFIVVLPLVAKDRRVAGARRDLPDRRWG
jgi:protein-histidine pros-kinase